MREGGGGRMRGREGGRGERGEEGGGRGEGIEQVKDEWSHNYSVGHILE